MSPWRSTIWPLPGSTLRTSPWTNGIAGAEALPGGFVPSARPPRRGAGGNEREESGEQEAGWRSS